MLICWGFLWAKILTVFIMGKGSFKDGSVLSLAPGNTHQRTPEWPQVCLSWDLVSSQCVSIAWHCSNKQHQVENEEVGRMQKQTKKPNPKPQDPAPDTRLKLEMGKMESKLKSIVHGGKRGAFPKNSKLLLCSTCVANAKKICCCPPGKNSGGYFNNLA